MRLKGDCSLAPALSWVVFVCFAFSGTLPGAQGQYDVRGKEIGGALGWLLPWCLLLGNSVR